MDHEERQATIEFRYCELRYDPEKRKLTGVAMRYGDVAKFPWGERETFEPGAFGEVGGLDVIMDLNHDRGRPLARTQGGGLVLTDSTTELRAEVVMPETREADDAMELVKTKVLRGLSVAFVPEEWVTRDEGKMTTTVITRATLLRVSLVDKPAYPKSRVDARRKESMDEAEVRALIEKAISERSEKEPIDVATLTRTICEGFEASTAKLREEIEATVRSEIEAALKERDEAQTAAAASERKAEEERAAAEQAKTDADDAVEKRADLLVQLQPLLPSGTETRGMSEHDLLVAAAGDEVKDAAERSTEYLLAKVEGILERRGDAHKGRPKGTQVERKASDGSVSVIRMIERRNIAAAV